MRVNPVPQPIDASDEEIRATLDAVEQTSPLLVAVACLTGEHDLLRDEFRPSPQSFDPTAGVSAEAAATARDAMAAALARFRDAGCVRAPSPDPDAIVRMFEFLAGEPVGADYVELMTEELALEGVDARAPGWRREEIAPDRPFRVVIIGAGMSGLATAHRLGQAGVDYVVFEKNADVGGTWLENRYPGCRVDVPNHFYSYSFAQTNEWPQYYSQQSVLLDYFRACADEFGIREHVRFDTEVLDATWDDAGGHWSVTVRDAKGHAETVRADAVVSAVGQLNRPKMPDIDGVDRFRGRVVPFRALGRVGGARAVGTSPSSGPGPARRSSSRRSPSGPRT